MMNEFDPFVVWCQLRGWRVLCRPNWVENFVAANSWTRNSYGYERQLHHCHTRFDLLMIGSNHFPQKRTWIRFHPKKAPPSCSCSSVLNEPNWIGNLITSNSPGKTCCQRRPRHLWFDCDRTQTQTELLCDCFGKHAWIWLFYNAKKMHEFPFWKNQTELSSSNQ